MTKAIEIAIAMYEKSLSKWNESIAEHGREATNSVMASGVADSAAHIVAMLVSHHLKSNRSTK